MNNKLLVSIIALLISSTAYAGEVNIKLLDEKGASLNGYYGCEWRMMNENGVPHPANPMYGTAYKGNLPTGTRWIVTVNCKTLGSGSHQVMSSSNNENYVINLHQFK